MSEIHSLSKALDLWKSIAEEAHTIHGEVARRRENYHDPEVYFHILCAELHYICIIRN